MSQAAKHDHLYPTKGRQYQTPREYCAAARISRATFWRMVKRKQIEVVKFGERCTRVPVCDAEGAR
jgi:hypothetical protein